VRWYVCVVYAPISGSYVWWATQSVSPSVRTLRIMWPYIASRTRLAGYRAPG
jgi:hypothetical protein